MRRIDPKGLVQRYTHVAAYEFHVLKPGRIEFPLLDIAVDGRKTKKRANPLVVEDSGITPADAFIEVQFGIPGERKWAYVGEAVPMKIQLFCSDKLNIHDAELKRNPLPVIQIADIDYRRFKTSRVDKRFHISQRRVVRDKRIYRVISFDAVIFPTRAGQLSGRVVHAVPILVDGKNSDDLMSVWSTAPKREVWHSVAANVPELEIRDLPGPPPDGALPTGLIGDVRLTLSADRKRLRVGEDFALKLKIRGKGNLEFVKPPVLELKGFDLYQPQTAVDIDTDQASILWMVTAKDTDAKLPELTFAAFSPSSGEWQTHQSQVSVEVQASEVIRRYGHIPPLFSGSRTPVRMALVRPLLPILFFLALFGPMVFIGVYILRIGRLSPAERRLRQELRRLQKELAKTDEALLPDFVCTRVYDWLRLRFDLPPGAGLLEITERLPNPELTELIERAAQANYQPSASTSLDKRRLTAGLRGLCCLLAIVCLPLIASDTPQSLYRAGKINAAAAGLKQRITSGRATVADLVNAAHCELVLGHYPEALLGYERARRLLPGNTMLRKQAADLRRQLNLTVEPSWRIFRDVLRPGTWCLLAGLCWTVGWLALAGLYWRHGRIVRRLLIPTLIAAAVPLAAAVHQTRTQWRRDGGLVLKNSSYDRLPKIPSSGGAMVHVGDDVLILAERGEWVRVAGPDGEGWIPRSAVGRMMPNMAGVFPGNDPSYPDVGE